MIFIKLLILCLETRDNHAFNIEAKHGMNFSSMILPKRSKQKKSTENGDLFCPGLQIL